MARAKGLTAAGWRRARHYARMAEAVGLAYQRGRIRELRWAERAAVHYDWDDLMDRIRARRRKLEAKGRRDAAR